MTSFFFFLVRVDMQRCSLDSVELLDKVAQSPHVAKMEYEP